MNRITTSIAALALTLTLHAQQTVSTPRQHKQPVIEHLDLGLTLGTTGIGLDGAIPLSSTVQLRTGFAVMPRFTANMHFGVQVGDDESTSASKFERLSSMLQTLTGYKVDDEVTMVGKPTYWNWKWLVDVRPLKNKHWHFTAGFYLGPSKIAKAYNTTEDMASLVSVGIYNNIYDRVASSPIITDPQNYFENHNAAEVLSDVQTLRAMGIDFGAMLPQEIAENYMFDPSDNPIKSMYDKIYNYGRMAIHVGDYSHDIVDENGNIIHHKGDPYMMEPDEASMVKARIKVNNFKPYLGVGYDGKLFKHNERYGVSCDAGLMFWGGTPQIITHDGTNLSKDVEHIHGKVGDYADAISSFKVFPVLNVRLTYRLF